MIGARDYWLTIANADNCAILSKMGFPFYATGRKVRLVAQGINVADHCVLYRSGKQKGFVGTFEVTERASEVATQLGFRVFPIRLPWRPLFVCLENPVALDQLVSKLEFVKDPRHYGTYFQVNIRRLSEVDFKAIEQAVVANATSLAR